MRTLSWQVQRDPVFQRKAGDIRLEEPPEKPGLDSAPPEPEASERKLPWEKLTGREVSVAELMLEGLTNPEIGRRLEISRRTVSSHVSNIFRKLRLHSRIELILRAREINAQTAWDETDPES